MVFNLFVFLIIMCPDIKEVGEHLEQRGELVEAKKAGNGQLLIRMANSFCCFAFSFLSFFCFNTFILFPAYFSFHFFWKHFLLLIRMARGGEVI